MRKNKNINKNINKYAEQRPSVKTPNEIFTLFKEIKEKKLTHSISNDYVAYGVNNSNYDVIDNAYEQSPTNAAIINSIVNYTIGDGLIDKNGAKISKLISEETFELICLDYKLYGSCAVQVLWNLNRDIAKIEYIDVKKIVYDVNEYGDVVGYYYSFDLKNKNKYPLKWLPKFDGEFPEFEVDGEVESGRSVMLINRTSKNDFFPGCDYESMLGYAELEGELATTALSFTKQSFKGSTIVNINGGVPPTDELRREYKHKIMSELTGAENAGSVIVSFNEDSSSAIVVEQLNLPEINQTWEKFNDAAEQKIFVGHNVPPILYSGSKTGSGLGNNKEELESATLSLFNRTIYPIRKKILNGLSYVLEFVDPSIELEVAENDVIKSIKNKMNSQVDEVQPKNEDNNDEVTN